MYAALLFAMVLTLVTGFLAGKEYDNMRRRVNYNRRLRREREEEEQYQRDEARRMAQEKKAFDFLYRVKWDGPR